MWKAVYRQLCLQSARQQAQGQDGIGQADLNAIVSPAAPNDGARAEKSSSVTSAEAVEVDNNNKRVRYSELVGKILSGTATDAEQNEAELIGAGLG